MDNGRIVVADYRTNPARRITDADVGVGAGRGARNLTSYVLTLAVDDNLRAARRGRRARCASTGLVARASGAGRNRHGHAGYADHDPTLHSALLLRVAGRPALGGGLVNTSGPYRPCGPQASRRPLRCTPSRRLQTINLHAPRCANRWRGMPPERSANFSAGLAGPICRVGDIPV